MGCSQVEAILGRGLEQKQRSGVWSALGVWGPAMEEMERVWVPQFGE